VGVLPVAFRFPGNSDVWLPANTIFPETTSRSGHNYLVVALLKPDVSLERAQAEMAAIGRQLAQEHPDSNKDKSVLVTRMRDEMVSDIRLTMYLLLGAVGLVLLIACANIATLLLAKATARSREIAIRAAVGASRARIVRQLVVESLVLGIAAAIGGTFIAIWGATALVALAPANVPRLAEAGLDARVLAFTLAISLLGSLLFGVAPALQASSVDLNEALKQGSGRAVVGGGTGTLRRGLVIVEIALSVILLSGAGLLIKSFAALHNVALGFRPENVLIAETSVPAVGVDGSRRAIRFYTELLPKLASLPGVSAVGATMARPGHVQSNGAYWFDAPPAQFTSETPQAVLSVITPGTFNALDIPLKRGRDFSDADTYDAPFTAIINEALARKSFAGEDPIGKIIKCGLDSDRPMKIVGIVGDVRQFGPARVPWPEIYMPYQQHPMPSTHLELLVRTSSNPAALMQQVRLKAREQSPDVPLKFTTLDASLAENIAAPRFRTVLLGIFAGVALALAMAGIYGVMAYVVGQRWSEIGLRMALGASSSDVLRLVLREAIALAAAGLAIGLAGAFAATRLLGSVLFNVKPSDPATYIGVAALLVIVALGASFGPAHRASRLDPLLALRQE
jgi:predicted permease